MALVEIAGLEAGQLGEALGVVDGGDAAAQGEQAALAQRAQGPIEMDGAEPEGVGQQVLVERAPEAGLGAELDQGQRWLSSTKKCAVRTSGLRRPIPTRCSTTIASSRDTAHSITMPSRGVASSVACSSARPISEATRSVTAAAEGSEVRNRRLRRPRKSPDLEVHDLPVAVGEQLVGECSAVLQDVGAGARLVLVHQLAARGEAAAPVLQSLQPLQLERVQPDERLELARDRRERRRRRRGRAQRPTARGATRHGS